MKVIFTGTEQDLIERGFKKGIYAYIEDCYTFGDDWNRDFIVISKNNEISILTITDDDICWCETALSKLGDLIDKNLVRWE